MQPSFKNSEQPVPESPIVDMDLAERLQHRIEGISAWLEKTAPEVYEEQLHQHEGSAERTYWHYGYRTALKDVLTLLGNANTSKN